MTEMIAIVALLLLFVIVVLDMYRNLTRLRAWRPIRYMSVKKNDEHDEARRELRWSLAFDLATAVLGVAGMMGVWMNTG